MEKILLFHKVGVFSVIQSYKFYNGGKGFIKLICINKYFEVKIEP